MADGARLSHRERDQDYRDVVVDFGDGWRVILCRDGIQWILQRHVAGRSRRPEWRGVRYCLSRVGLIAVSVSLRGGAEGLENLPTRAGSSR